MFVNTQNKKCYKYQNKKCSSKKIFNHQRQTNQEFVKFNEKITNSQQQNKQNKKKVFQNRSDFAKKDNDEIIQNQ